MNPFDPFAYVPSIFAILLIFTGPFSDSYITEKIKEFSQLHPNVGSPQVIANIAIDWAMRLNLFNATIITIVSCVALYSSSHSIALVLGSILLVLTIFAAGFWPVAVLGIDQLSVRYGKACNGSLIALNVVLIIIIGLGQHNSWTHTHPKANAQNAEVH